MTNVAPDEIQVSDTVAPLAHTVASRGTIRRPPPALRICADPGCSTRVGGMTRGPSLWEISPLRPDFSDGHRSCEGPASMYECRIMIGRAVYISSALPGEACQTRPCGNNLRARPVCQPVPDPVCLWARLVEPPPSAGTCGSHGRIKDESQIRSAFRPRTNAGRKKGRSRVIADESKRPAFVQR